MRWALPVFPRDDRLQAFARLDVPVVASLSHATAIRIGQALGASQVVIGDFELSVGELTVRARTIRLDTGRIGPELAERGPLTDIFGVYARVARRLVPESRVSLEEMEQGHPPLTAFEVYIKGLLAEAPATRLSFLNQALKLAPAFQRARIALWHAHAAQNEHQRGLALVAAGAGRAPVQSAGAVSGRRVAAPAVPLPGIVRCDARAAGSSLLTPQS